MSGAETPRITLVLDATGAGPRGADTTGASRRADVESQAQSLAGFLRDGLHDVGPAALREAVTVLFCGGGDDSEKLVALAPTEQVELVGVPPFRAGAMATELAELPGGSDLVVFAAGAPREEAATRLAAATGGAVMTGVLDAVVESSRLVCRRSAYAAHLAGRFALEPRPWSLVLDAGWADGTAEPAREHSVLLRQNVRGPGSAAARAARASAGFGQDRSAPVLEDLEFLEPPQRGDLQTAAFLVVAGRGAGSRGSVERIAAAAARMGAAFGVTRPVVMNAWAGPDRQIGVSGARTAPSVCVVAGASGAPAFIRGVERAGFIAAVDTDDHAPIAGESDAFVAGDAVAVLEALAELVAPTEDA